ncbi:unnamed protein product, partial [Symbiodinium sp. KB8]
MSTPLEKEEPSQADASVNVDVDSPPPPQATPSQTSLELLADVASENGNRPPGLRKRSHPQAPTPRKRAKVDRARALMYLRDGVAEPEAEIRAWWGKAIQMHADFALDAKGRARTRRVNWLGAGSKKNLPDHQVLDTEEARTLLLIHAFLRRGAVEEPQCMQAVSVLLEKVLPLVKERVAAAVGDAVEAEELDRSIDRVIAAWKNPGSSSWSSPFGPWVWRMIDRMAGVDLSREMRLDQLTRWGVLQTFGPQPRSSAGGSSEPIASEGGAGKNTAPTGSEEAQNTSYPGIDTLLPVARLVSSLGWWIWRSSFWGRPWVGNSNTKSKDVTWLEDPPQPYLHNWQFVGSSHPPAAESQARHQNKQQVTDLLVATGQWQEGRGDVRPVAPLPGEARGGSPAASAMAQAMADVVSDLNALETQVEAYISSGKIGLQKNFTLPKAELGEARSLIRAKLRRKLLQLLSNEVAINAERQRSEVGGQPKGLTWETIHWLEDDIVGNLPELADSLDFSGVYLSFSQSLTAALPLLPRYLLDPSPAENTVEGFVMDSIVLDVDHEARYRSLLEQHTSLNPM